MKRDLEVIKKILIAVKKEETSFSLPLYQAMLGFSDIDESIYNENILLLNESGLIDTIEERIDHHMIFNPIHLTLNGKRFLENIQNVKIWKKLLILDSKISTSMNLILMIPLAEHFAQNPNSLN